MQLYSQSQRTPARLLPFECRFPYSDTPWPTRIIPTVVRLAVAALEKTSKFVAGLIWEGRRPIHCTRLPRNPLLLRHLR